MFDLGRDSALEFDVDLNVDLEAGVYPDHDVGRDTGIEVDVALNFDFGIDLDRDLDFDP